MSWPTAAAGGSLRPKIFSGARSTGGGRPRGLSVSHRMNVYVGGPPAHCQRPEDINNEKQADFGEPTNTQWKTGSLFAEADEWRGELEWKLLRESG